jgi:hypothetical protein
MHRKERMISGFGRHLLPTPSEYGHPASEDSFPGRKFPPTFHHGFDLSIDQTCRDGPTKVLNYEAVPGYYATDLCATALPIRLIAMNTAKMDEWGADAHIPPGQRAWLEGVLPTGDEGISMVFAHHRPDEFDADTLGVLNRPGRAPMVMFTGHTHKHHIKLHGDSGGPMYYELNTGAILEYPQIGRLIELRGTPQGRVWLLSRAFWSSLMAVGDMPMKQEVAETLDQCVQDRLTKRENLAEAVKCGHYGALKDYWGNKKKVLGRPQPFADAWENANVIIPIRR